MARLIVLSLERRQVNPLINVHMAPRRLRGALTVKLGVTVTARLPLERKRDVYYLDIRTPIYQRGIWTLIIITNYSLSLEIENLNKLGHYLKRPQLALGLERWTHVYLLHFNACFYNLRGFAFIAYLLFNFHQTKRHKPTYSSWFCKNGISWALNWSFIF